MKLFVLMMLFMGDLSFPKLEYVSAAVQWPTPTFTSPEARRSFGHELSYVCMLQCNELFGCLLYFLYEII